MIFFSITNFISVIFIKNVKRLEIESMEPSNFGEVKNMNDQTILFKDAIKSNAFWIIFV